MPSVFRDDLLGILLLGEKKDNSRFKDDELNFFTALASDVAMAIRNAQLLPSWKRSWLSARVCLCILLLLWPRQLTPRIIIPGHISRVTNYSLAIAQRLKKYKK